MTITFKGVGANWRSSAEIRAELAENDTPVILSFSRGKDSIATWIGLLESGVKPENIHPVYYYRVPNLRFTEESLKRYEDHFQKHILRVPHPSLFGQLRVGMYQPIHRTGVIIACSIPEITYQDLESQIREELTLPEDTPVLTGVRAADGIARRTYLKRSGPYSAKKKRLAAIWDWTIAECYEAIERHGIDIMEFSPDYKWFRTIRNGKPVKNSGRTFDGIAYQFLAPLREYAPDDYQRILHLFPLAELEMIRYEQL